MFCFVLFFLFTCFLQFEVLGNKEYRLFFFQVSFRIFIALFRKCNLIVPDQCVPKISALLIVLLVPHRPAPCLQQYRFPSSPFGVCTCLRHTHCWVFSLGASQAIDRDPFRENNYLLRYYNRKEKKAKRLAFLTHTGHLTVEKINDREVYGLRRTSLPVLIWGRNHCTWILIGTRGPSRLATSKQNGALQCLLISNEVSLWEEWQLRL